MARYNEDIVINDNDLILRQKDVDRIYLDTSKSDLKIGGNGSNGEIHLYSDVDKLDDGVIRALLAPYFMWMRNADGVETVRIDGATGDITLSGADCAELFDAEDTDACEPGTVLVVDDHERLSPCCLEYDRRVAGIVSGAGGLRPGVTLGAFAPGTAQVPVALTGKAYCKVDAQFGAIDVGDLLTTSPTPGHAMCARDSSRAFGAVIGKALRGHPDSLGLIPVLVALQ